MKTSELTGAALDWAVAKCEGWEAGEYMMSPDIRKNAQGKVIGVMVPKNREYVFWKPSTDWAQGGPIIEREGMDLNPHGIDSSNGRAHWRAAIQWLDESDFEGIGPTPLIAAMRCYVASKLGDDVEIPEELMEQA